MEAILAHSPPGAVHSCLGNDVAAPRSTVIASLTSAWALVLVIPLAQERNVVAAEVALVYRENQAARNTDLRLPGIYTDHTGPLTAALRADRGRAPRHRRVAGPFRPT